MINVEGQRVAECREGGKRVKDETREKLKGFFGAIAMIFFAWALLWMIEIINRG